MRRLIIIILSLLIVLSCKKSDEEENGQPHLKNDTIIAHYMLDGDALDTSGNSINGILYGNPEITADRTDDPGSALHFDGSDDFISADIGNHDPIAISLWFAHRNNETGKAYVIFDYGVNAFRGEVDMTSGATKTYCYINDTSIIEMRSPKMIYSNDMIWHHLYVDSGSDTINPRMYIDGYYEGMLEEKQSLNIIDNLIYFGRAGSEAFTNATYFDGKIDDIRIYNRVLGENEILSIIDNYSFE
ncbi:MAG: LamG domain-containing protein [Bacteroidales bacterium]|nr:MAG: LamG domain-containing protein [Bacteroidales bacterium]